MSQEMALSAGPAESVPFTGVNEFGYRPVPVLAPVVVFIGVCSIVSLIAIPGLTVPALGLVLGCAALWQIRRSQNELGGWKLTVAGMAICIAFLASGSALHAYNYITELPEGHERLNFVWLSKQKPVIENGRMKIAAEAQAWDNRKVLVKGYMYPTKQTHGLTEFLLCKDSSCCFFGAKPKLEDTMTIVCQDGLKVNYKEKKLVSVAGTFRAKKQIIGGEPVSLYTLEATHFK